MSVREEACGVENTERNDGGGVGGVAAGEEQPKPLALKTFLQTGF